MAINELFYIIREGFMTTGGWVMVIIAWGIIIGLCLYCFKRLFDEKRKS